MAASSKDYHIDGFIREVCVNRFPKVRLEVKEGYKVLGCASFMFLNYVHACQRRAEPILSTNSDENDGFCIEML